MISNWDLHYWEKEIDSYSDEVYKIISKENEREKISEKLINNLRHFCESIMCYIKEFYEPIKESNQNKKKGASVSFCKKNNKFKFIVEFCDCLNGSIGHARISYAGEYAERLFLNYYEPLIKIKKLFKSEFNLNILNDLEKYPLDLDDSFLKYYRLIKATISNKDLNNNLSGCDSYYIKKKKMLFIDGDIFYEYTLTNATDNISRFERFIAFSLLDIPFNYAFKGKMVEKCIDFIGKRLDYQVVVGFDVAIRPCEFDKLYKIMGIKHKCVRNNEYRNLMKYIKDYDCPLNRIVELPKKEYDDFKEKVFKQKSALFRLMNACRKFLNGSNYAGKNILRYLLFMMNNNILISQLPKDDELDDCLSNINLSKKTYSFDKSPFSMNPVNHVTNMKDLLNVYNISEHKDEIFARILRDISIKKNKIYISKKEFDYEHLDEIINIYNNKYNKDSLEERKIYQYGNHIYLNEYEIKTKEIIKKLMEYTNSVNFKEYESYIDAQIKENGINFDDEKKEIALKKMFSKSSLFAVYGAAGTGKSYFAKYVLSTIGDIKKVCVTSTNQAVDNMRKRFKDESASYLTITKYLKEFNNNSNVDLLVIDECSAVSAIDMYNIVKKTSPKLILLLGDIYQLKSIEFGNWFSLLKKNLKNENFVELEKKFRSDSEVLICLWDQVRKLDKNIINTLEKNEISHKLDDTFFQKCDDDEIILCLNYDGLYGINNINKVLQNNNPNKEMKWKQYTFKIGDPILFDNNIKYKNVFHNNLKGKILDIFEDNTKFKFTVCVDKVLNPLLCHSSEIDFVGTNGEKSIVSFIVNKYDENYYDNDSEESNKFPFHVAYALSIHKAQGLEYNSVKIIISNEVEEQITHSIFYTAITRAKNSLNIYWTPETEKKIINSLCIDNVDDDYNILLSRYPELRLRY